MEMMLSSLGNDIRNFRMEAGLSQEQLSILCGILTFNEVMFLIV